MAAKSESFTGNGWMLSWCFCRVTDVPAQGRGRAYLVERGLEQDGYGALKALVADYVEQGELLAAVPMTVSPLESEAGEEMAR